MQAAGFAALAFRPEAAPLAAAILLGAGLGGGFAFSMIVALDHLPDPVGAGTLSALMQGGGLRITALPPWIVAVLHGATGSFAAGWLLHLASTVPVAVLYWQVTPASYAERRANLPEPAAGSRRVMAKPPERRQDGKDAPAPPRRKEPP